MNRLSHYAEVPNDVFPHSPVGLVGRSDPPARHSKRRLHQDKLLLTPFSEGWSSRDCGIPKVRR